MAIEGTRREFIKGSLAFGGFVAAAGLPAFADNPKHFPKRGAFERLSIIGCHVDAGAEKPFSILHISDTHLTAASPDDSEWARKEARRRSLTFGGRQEEALRDSLTWAKKHVDYVVHTGDLIDFQSQANFDLARKYFGDGMFGCIGNHEFYHGQKVENEKTKGETREAVAAAFPFDISVASKTVNGVNFVALDNVYGHITAAQMTRLEAEFKKGLPVILCMHCPLMTRNISRVSSKFWDMTSPKAVPDVGGFKEVTANANATFKDYNNWLKAQPLLKCILAGHIHVSVSDRFSPTCVEHVVGGNFLFHGQEITIS